MVQRLRGLAGETFSSLRSPNYRLWFVGQSISMVGFWVQMVAQALLVLELSDSGAVLGFATALQFLPTLVVGAWAGVLSDRLEKRRLLIVTQSTMMLTAFTLGVLVLTDHATLTSVLLLAGVTGTAFAFDQPARRTIVTELVGDEDAANAVSLNGALGVGAKILGPAVAGITIATAGMGWCFIINGATSVAVLAALIRMDTEHIRRHPTLPRGEGRIREGLSYVWSRPEARLPLLILVPVAILGFNWNVLLPLLATRDLAGSAADYAALMALMSVGSLAGTLWLARRPAADTRFIAVCTIALGLSSAMLAVAPTVAVAGVPSIAVGATSMVLFNGSVVSLQLGAPPALRGRVMAIFSIVFMGSHAVGGPVAGWLAELLGARIAVGTGGAVAFAVGVVALAYAPRLTATPPAVAPRGTPPTPPADMVTVDA